MMYTFYEQLVMIIYFILYGMFLIISYDILNYYLNKLVIRKLIYYLVEAIYWVVIIIISLLFMLRVTKGYIPLYTFLFFIVGIIIYLLYIQKSFLVDLKRFDLIFSKILVKIIKVIWNFIFPKEVFFSFKKLFKKIILKTKNAFKKIFQKKEISPEINNM